MHVGEPIVLIVAESQAAARDAAELVEIGYDPLPHVTTVTEAVANGAPQLWPQAAGQPRDRLVDADGCERAATGSTRSSRRPRTSRASTAVNQRIAVSSMETARRDGGVRREAGSLPLRSCSQGRDLACASKSSPSWA